MRHWILWLAAIGMISGCATAHQERAATSGAIIGATAGAVIGAQSNRVAEGAVIGGVIGGLAGAVLAEGAEDRVVPSEPRYHRRSCARGQSYFDRAARARNLDSKIALMREGLRLCPQNPAAHNDLGVALMLRGERGDYREAAAHFRHALRIDPDYVPARRNLARLERGFRHHRRMHHEHRGHHKHEYRDEHEDDEWHRDDRYEDD